MALHLLHVAGPEVTKTGLRVADCHPDKLNFGRGLCSACYSRHAAHGTLAQFPVMQRGPTPGRKRKDYEASLAKHRVAVIRTIRGPLEGGPHAPPCRCAIPAPRTDGPLVVCGLCSREVAA